MTPPTPDPVERIADVVVEVLPGDRELSERVARAVAPLLIEARADELRSTASAVDSEGHHWSGASAHAFFRFADKLRDRADGLSGDESHGGDSVHDRLESGSDRQQEPLSNTPAPSAEQIWEQEWAERRRAYFAGTHEPSDEHARIWDEGFDRGHACAGTDMTYRCQRGEPNPYRGTNEGDDRE